MALLFRNISMFLYLTNMLEEIERELKLAPSQTRLDLTREAIAQEKAQRERLRRWQCPLNCGIRIVVVLGIPSHGLQSN